MLIEEKLISLVSYGQCVSGRLDVSGDAIILGKKPYHWFLIVNDMLLN